MNDIYFGSNKLISKA